MVAYRSRSVQGYSLMHLKYPGPASFPSFASTYEARAKVGILPPELLSRCGEVSLPSQQIISEAVRTHNVFPILKFRTNDESIFVGCRVFPSMEHLSNVYLVSWCSRNQELGFATLGSSRHKGKLQFLVLEAVESFDTSVPHVGSSLCAGAEAIASYVGVPLTLEALSSAVGFYQRLGYIDDGTRVRNFALFEDDPPDIEVFHKFRWEPGLTPNHFEKSCWNIFNEL